MHGNFAGNVGLGQRLRGENDLRHSHTRYLAQLFLVRRLRQSYLNSVINGRAPAIHQPCPKRAGRHLFRRRGINPGTSDGRRRIRRAPHAPRRAKRTYMKISTGKETLINVKGLTRQFAMVRYSD